MSRSIKLMLCGCAVMLAVGTTQAQEVNWKLVEAGYVNLDPDNGQSEDGWFIGASWGFIKWLHVFGEFGDLGPIDESQLGAGWHGLLGERADLFADAAFYDIDVDDGIRARFGVRWMVAKRFEFDGYLAWTDLNLVDNSSVGVNVIWDFAKRAGVGVNYEWGDEYSTGRAFIRYNFGQR